MTKTEIELPAAVVAAKRAIIQIGTGGRGFIVGAAKDRRYIITAAHCLPQFPEPHLANSANELSYQDILSALGKPERKIWAELVEFNSASDFAVLGAPDDQALWEEYDQYEEFTEHATMRIAESPPPPPLQLPDFHLMSEADLRPCLACDYADEIYARTLFSLSYFNSIVARMTTLGVMRAIGNPGLVTR